MNRIRGKLTYSNVMVTVLAVLVIGGGTAYAAAEMLPKNSVGVKQIERGAVTPAKLSKASKATMKGPAGGKGATGERGETGPQGPQGNPGTKGDPGTAKAWAEIDNAGVVVRSSPGVTASLVSTGTYCVKAEPFNNSNSIAVVTLNDSDPDTNIGDGVVIASTETANACPDGGHYFAVYPSNTTGAQKDAGFLILID